MVADERRALADLVEALDPDQLATQSLCSRWSVRDVAAHLAMPLEFGIPKIMVAMVASFGDFDKANDRLSREIAQRDVATIAGILRDQADNRFTPPTAGAEAPLTDLLVHGQDIRRPLGITRTFAEDRLRTALAFVTGSRSRGFVAPHRLDGLAFETTDLDWHAGTGAAVRGTGEAVLLGITGRTVALDDLEGEGVALLRRR